MSGEFIEYLESQYEVKDAPTTNPDIAEVSLIIPEYIAKEVCVKDGIPARSLTLTLLRFEASNQIKEELLIDFAELLDNYTYGLSSQRVKITGYGALDHGAATQRPYFLAVEETNTLRDTREQLVKFANRTGLPVVERTTFKPHILLAYLSPRKEKPKENLETPTSFISEGLKFTCCGREVSFLFDRRREVFSKAVDEVNEAGVLIDRAKKLLAGIGGHLRQIEQQDKVLSEHAERLSRQHKEAEKKLSSRVYAPRGSALEEAVLDHNEQAAIAKKVSEH